MNYLAHAFLSFDNPGIVVGNLISDFVKGKQQYLYPDVVRKGIILHRNIDTFTDAHPATRQAKVFFQDPYRLYSGAFVDVVYDHFLAGKHDEFEPYDGLGNFAQKIYATIEHQIDICPARFQLLFPSMKYHDWLYNYGIKNGIRQSFRGIAHRAVYLQEAEIAFEIFEEKYAELKKCFDVFFPEVKMFASDNLRNLIQH